jgi:hypothetical protein
MRLFSCLRLKLQRQLDIANAPLRNLAERQLLLQALAAAKTNRDVPRLPSLDRAEFCAFSQWGEDGIIDWLVERLPGIPESFVEFGVEDYRESNTRLLLLLRNWCGLVIDGSQHHIDSIRRQDIYWRRQLTATCAFIDRDNINTLISDAGLHGEIGLLSVDIDGNDYWVWQAIDIVNPVIVVCEYNAVLGDLYSLSVPYVPTFQRTKAHHSNLYFGASLQAMIGLGRRKGYTFVGTTSTGCNAFFVRDDRASPVLDALEGVVAFPSRVRECRDPQGRLLFTSGLERSRVIQNQPLVNTETSESTSLAKLSSIYSPQWGDFRKALV